MCTLPLTGLILASSALSTTDIYNACVEQGFDVWVVVCIGRTGLSRREELV